MYFPAIERIVSGTENAVIGMGRCFIGTTAIILIVVTQYTIKRYTSFVQFPPNIAGVELRPVAHKVAAVDTEHIVLLIRVYCLFAILHNLRI